MKAKEAAEIIKGIEEVRGSLPEDGLLVEEALNMAIKALELFGISEQLPSAQPERPKGEWIPQDHNKSNGFATTLVYYFPKCSECGHSGDSAFAFCHWCGADMRG